MGVIVFWATGGSVDVPISPGSPEGTVKENIEVVLSDS
jgi:hypothetical protein